MIGIDVTIEIGTVTEVSIAISGTLIVISIKGMIFTFLKAM